MKNKIKSGHTLTVARAAASKSGVAYDLGSGLVGVALGAYLANESGEYETSGVKEFKKLAGETYAIGDTIDYDDALEQAVSDAHATSDFELGVCVEIALSASVLALVMVNKNPGPGPSFS